MNLSRLDLIASVSAFPRCGDDSTFKLAVILIFVFSDQMHLLFVSSSSVNYFSLFTKHTFDSGMILLLVFTAWTSLSFWSARVTVWAAVADASHVLESSTV